MKPEDSLDKAIYSSFTSLSREEKIVLLTSLFRQAKEQHQLTEGDILGKREDSLPFGIFATSKISSLESIVKYLKESKGLSFAKISKLLNRSNKTIWATYSQASKKMPEPFGDVRDEILMPASLIANRSYSVLEHVVQFAKSLGKTNHEVALLLHLDDRTIWAVYDRVKKKKGVGRQ